MNIKLIAGMILSLAMSGCATIVNGTKQSLQITTGKVTGADCELKSTKKNKESQKFQSPAVLTVRRSHKAVKLKCSKTGYETAEKTIEANLARATAGNLLAGGPGGVIVDAATGAAHKYPSHIDLPLRPVSQIRLEDSQLEKETDSLKNDS